VHNGHFKEQFHFRGFAPAEKASPGGLKAYHRKSILSRDFLHFFVEEAPRFAKAKRASSTEF